MGLQTQNKIKVAVSSMPGDWAKATNIGGQLNSQSVRATANGPKVVLSGDYEPEDVSVVRFVDAVRDAQLLDRLAAGESFAGTTVTLAFIDAAGIVIGSPQTFTGCSMKSWSQTDADANGDSPVELTVTWKVGTK